MAIKKSELLLAVCRIVSGIQIDGDTAGTAMQPLSVALDDAVGKSLAHAKQFFAIHTIFKAREGWLRSEIFSFHRIPTHQEFVHRVGSQTRCVVAIFVAAGDGHDSLRQQLLNFVTNLPCLPFVFQTSRQGFGESQAPVGGLEEDGAPIGAALHLIKLRDDGPLKNSREHYILCCGMFVHAKASRLV